MLITYIIIAFIAAVLFVFANRDELSDTDTLLERAGFAFVSVLVGGFISFCFYIACFFITLVVSPPAAEYVFETTTPVYALEDNYFLTIRGSNSAHHEVLYIVEGEYGLQTKSLTKASDRVYFDTIEEGEEPCLETYNPIFEKGFWDLFIKTENIPDKEIFIFKVPENSIKQDHNIDLQ